MIQTADRFTRTILTLLGAFLFTASANASDFSEPWKRNDRALVIDAYEYNPIDWQKLVSDKRVVGFINKASDGVSPAYQCSGNETEVRLCKALWKRHAVARELFHTRRTVAKALGLKWGAYHLGRPGNPIEQANNFIDFAEPGPDDFIAIDVEENDPAKWMSLKDAETFARHIHTRLGRWPVLYTNGSTALHIAENRERYSLLSRLPLWYARYKPAIGLHFPKGHWDSYTLWQFSAAANCNSRSCPYRVPGTPLDIDVNVASMSADELRAEWPFGGLIDETAGKVATIPVPIARRTAIEGGDVNLQYARVEDGEPPAIVAATPPAIAPDIEQAKIALADQPAAEPEIQPAQMTVESGETVPLPIWRSDALKGRDVRLKFAAVVQVVASATLNSARREQPFQVLLGRQHKPTLPVELASYAGATEKAQAIRAQSVADDGPGNVSAAALDDPGPNLSATRFVRTDLPVFLLKKLDGEDEALP